MSHWDFGRPADGQPDAPAPAGPASAAYPPDLPRREPRKTTGGPRTRAGQRRRTGRPATAGGAGPVAGARVDTGRRLVAGRAAGPGPGTGPADRRAGPRPSGVGGWGWSAEDGWDDDEEDAGPYPLTYERDDFAAGAVPGRSGRAGARPLGAAAAASPRALAAAPRPR